MSEMSLQGRLADFSLEEILQLMALQQKTGLLTVEASLPMALSFDSGYLVGFRDRRDESKDPLESFIRNYGYLTSEQWEHIEFIRDNSRLDLTEILLNEGMFTEEELEATQYESTQEHIFHGMRLEDGRYNFASGRDALVGLKGRIRLKVDGLLMEAVRRIDEWPHLQERYGADHLKVRRVNPAEDLSHRGDAEKRILGIVGEASELGEIVRRAKLSEFDVLSLVEMMRKDDILHVQDAPKKESTTKKRKKRDRGELRPSPIKSIAWAVATLAIVFAGLTFQPWGGYRASAGIATVRHEAFESARDVARARAELELYARRRGRYPDKLSQLSAEGLMSPETVSGVQKAWSYEPSKNGKGYKLSDRKAGD